MKIFYKFLFLFIFVFLFSFIFLRPAQAAPQCEYENQECNCPSDRCQGVQVLNCSQNGSGNSCNFNVQLSLCRCDARLRCSIVDWYWCDPTCGTACGDTGGGQCRTRCPDCTNISYCNSSCGGGGPPPTPPPPSPPPPPEPTPPPGSNCEVDPSCGGHNCSVNEKWCNNDPDCLDTHPWCNGSNSSGCYFRPACVGSTPTPTPAVGNPIGYLDGADCATNMIWGWSGDPDNIYASNSVDFYFDGPVGSGALLSFVAQDQNEPLVCTLLGGQPGECGVCSTPSSQPQCLHRFYKNIPDTILNQNTGQTINLHDGNQHMVYAYGNNLSGSGSTIELIGNPKTFTCPASTPTPTSAPAPSPTPTPFGTIRARAVIIASDEANNCTAINNSVDYLNNTVLSISPLGDPPSSRVQSGGNYVGWTGGLSSYTISASPGLPNYGLAGACWSITPQGTNGSGLSATLNSGGQELTWNLGFVPPGPWSQIQGGDLYTASSVVSLMPQAIPERYFNLNAVNNNPGLVVFGSGNPSAYDFAIEDPPGRDEKGRALVSSKNWLANDIFLPVMDYYSLFYNRFGSPTQTNYTGPNQPVCASESCVYFTDGDLTVSDRLTTWNIPTGKKLTFLVNGALIIDGNINLTGNGFVAFIVKSGITVTEHNGQPYNVSTPSLEGVYITNNTFSTGPSLVNGYRRFVGKGVFVANSFLLQRDLGNIAPSGHNYDTSSELFVYNPGLFFLMPQEMRGVSAKWEEVAP